MLRELLELSSSVNPLVGGLVCERGDRELANERHLSAFTLPHAG